MPEIEWMREQYHVCGLGPEQVGSTRADAVMGSSAVAPPYHHRPIHQLPVTSTMPPKQKQQSKPQAPAKGDIQIVDGKRKFTPRPPIPAAERLPRLYRALTDQVNDGYFDNAKKTCKRSELTRGAAWSRACGDQSGWGEGGERWR